MTESERKRFPDLCSRRTKGTTPPFFFFFFEGGDFSKTEIYLSRGRALWLK